MLLAHLVSGRYGDHAVEPGPHTTPVKSRNALLRWIAVLFGKKA
jgi:hypothetical protein